jgi:hypothetical protein
MADLELLRDYESGDQRRSSLRSDASSGPADTLTFARSASCDKLSTTTLSNASSRCRRPEYRPCCTGTAGNISGSILWRQLRATVPYEPVCCFDHCDIYTIVTHVQQLYVNFDGRWAPITGVYLTIVSWTGTTPASPYFDYDQPCDTHLYSLLNSLCPMMVCATFGELNSSRQESTALLYQSNKGSCKIKLGPPTVGQVRNQRLAATESGCGSPPD